MTKDSEKNISFRNGISTNSTNRILYDLSKDELIKNNGKLPTSFGIDEFKATKDTVSKMAFIIVDHDKKIYLILIILDFLMTSINTFLDIHAPKEIMSNLLLWTYLNLIIN